MLKNIKYLLLSLIVFVLSATPVTAMEDKILGVHLLSTQDINRAEQLLKVEDDWHFLTIALTLDDLNQEKMWQDFFNQCRQKRFIPIVRLATRVENGVWIRPNRKQIVQMFLFLNNLDWPTDKLFLVVFNEVNHAKEWGGVVDVPSYVETLDFVSRWAHTEEREYIVLPAAMDLDAPDRHQTMEAFNYLNQMYRYDSSIFNKVDVWNSHSYPNPAFSSSPKMTGKNSLRGFIHELDFLKRKTGQDYKVIITETGWKANYQTKSWLEDYYLYAFQHIWSHPQVIGVTPFVLQGSPGPFSDFSFYDSNDQPTVHYSAFQKALKQLEQE